MAKRLKLGELLVHEGVLEPLQLRAALLEQQKIGGRIGAILVGKGYVTERTLVAVLSRQLGYPAVDLDTANVPKNVIAMIDPDFAKRNMIIPLGLKGQKVLLVAMADPTNLPLIGELEFRTNCRIEPVIAGETAISKAISRLYYGVEMRGPSAQQAEELSELKMINAGGETVMVVAPEGSRADPDEMPTEQLPPVQPPKPEVYFGMPEPDRYGTPSVVRQALSGPEGAARPEPFLPRDAAERIQKLEEAVKRLEAMQVKLLRVVKDVSALLVEKGIVTRTEFKERIARE